MVAAADVVGELPHDPCVALRGKEFRRHRLACDDEKVGGRYVEFGGKFGESLRGGVGSARGEAAQDGGTLPP